MPCMQRQGLLLGIKKHLFWFQLGNALVLPLLRKRKNKMIHLHLLHKAAPMHATRREILKRLEPAAAKCLSEGYWWCYTCQKRITPDVNQEFNKCPGCRGPKIRWFYPL